MAEIYYQEDYNLSMLEGKAITVIEHGSQGHAHAFNTEKSGCHVIIGLCKGNRSWARAEAAGFGVYTATRTSRRADIIMILTNDGKQANMYKESIEPSLTESEMLTFTHGFAIHPGQVVPPKNADVTMTAPKRPGHTVGSQYQEGKGVPYPIAVCQDVTGKTRDLALVHTPVIGDTEAGVLETTFREEIETDLFDEQAALCGGVIALVKAGFEALVEIGYEPESVYFECIHEMKLAVDLIFGSGFADTRYSISSIAEYGGCITGPKAVIDETKKVMKKVLSNTQDGTLTKDWPSENKVSCPYFNAMRKGEVAYQSETTGVELRKLYSWNDGNKLTDN